MVRMTVFALAACAALAPGCSRERPDANVNAAVVARLDKEPSLQTAIVHARTEQGHVYLTGRVMSPEQRRRAEDLADDVRGVKGVTNDIEVDVATPPVTPPVPPQESPTAPPPGPMGNEPPTTTPMPDPPEGAR